VTPLNRGLRWLVPRGLLGRSLLIILVPLVILGVYPKPVLDMSAASVEQLVSNYQTAISAVKAAALVQ